MAQFILDCFPDAVSEFGLLGCAAFVAAWLVMLGGPIAVGVWAMRASLRGEL